LSAHRHTMEYEDFTDPFELLLQVSHEGICLLDAAGLCQGISATGAQLLGYLPRDLDGRPFHDLVHAASDDRLEECPLCGLLMEAFSGEALLTMKDGTAFEASCTARPLLVGPGLRGRLIVFTKLSPPPEEGGAKDAGTEAVLRRAAAELAAEKQRTESLHAFGRQLLVTPLGDLDAALVDQFCTFTDSKLGLFYRVDEPEKDLVLAGSHGLFRSGVANKIAPGQGTLGLALSARCPVVEDHAASPVELAGRSIRHIMYVPLSDGEEDLGALILARTATRPYSRQEQESVAQLADLASVALANNRLVGRLEQLSQLTRAALDGIVEAIRLVDPEGRELLVNASMRHLDDELGLHGHRSLYGAEAAEFAGRTTDPEGYLAELREMQLNPERRSRTEWELEDSARVFERYTAPIRDSLGTLIGRVLVLREMTAERGAENLQAELISVVSHELRTPLTSMLGFTNVLLGEDLEEGEWSLHVETVRGEIVRLLAIVDDLLEFQRVGAGRFVPERTRFDLRDLIKEQAAALANASTIHRLIVEHEADPLVVEADRDRIAQVLSNLLTNAIKYSPEGGPVRVSAERKADRIRVSISDSGIGIPEDQRDKVFTKFVRIESAETAHIRGLGLGLALSREIVAAHGGAIGFDSAAGAGSVFWFDLPAD
jgi:signal transduction histidine kinase